MSIITKVLNKLFLKNKDIMSFKAAMDLCELPVVTFYQKDKKFNFLLDTGSNSSIIDKNALPNIEYENSDLQANLFGLEGQKKRVDACKITLYFNNKGYTFDYLVSDLKDPFNQIKQESGVTIHGIIGSRFFNEFKYVLDFDELIAYSKK